MSRPLTFNNNEKQPLPPLPLQQFQRLCMTLQGAKRSVVSFLGTFA